LFSDLAVARVVFFDLPMMSKVARKRPEYPDDIEFVVTIDNERVSSEIDTVLESVRSEADFWDEIYPSPTGQRLMMS
jgi:hypothetical protein